MRGGNGLSAFEKERGDKDHPSQQLGVDMDVNFHAGYLPYNKFDIPADACNK